RPLPLGSIEPLCKRAALAAFVALPEVGRGIIVDHPSDIDRKRVKRVDAITCRGLLGVGSLAGRDRGPLRAGFARRAWQEIGKPTAIAAFAVVLAAGYRAERGWARAPRRRTRDITRPRLL